MKIAGDHRQDLVVSLSLAAKRLLDLVVAALLFLFLSPVILLLALLVKLDSPGPAFYKHQRIGKDGKPFAMFKFRSMQSAVDDKEYIAYLKGLIESSQGTANAPYQKMNGDKRITRLGSFLRKYYLDELPQFWNIVKGEMSLVGPRPHVQLEVDYYTPEQRRRLAVRPGATGLWQVQGKADCSFQELIALDLEYIDDWSLALDLQILWQTVLLMARGGEGTWARLEKRAPGERARRFSRRRAAFHEPDSQPGRAQLAEPD
jgi:lipopolysaccharide/colanic/teichoic acid biosynthesis glycosyltransferase